MKTYFKNAKIMTMENGVDIFEGELLTENDVIVYCGKKIPDDSELLIGDIDTIDCRGNLLMPGFKNAHTHTAMTFARNLADDKPLQSWLTEDIFPREARLTEEIVYQFSKLGFLEYLTSGITSCFDMYMKYDGHVQAAKEYGFRTVLMGSVNNYGGDAKEIETQYNKYNNCGPLISYIPGFHAEYTTSYSLLSEVADMAKQLHAPLFAHNSETEEEVQGCIERYGKTPTELMDSLGMFEYGGGGFHCIYLSDNDYRIFREKKLYAVTNPSSNLKLASGVASVERMRKEGIQVAIGTDGPASNNALDFFREMFLVTGLQKVKEKDPTASNPEFILESATKVGAAAMGLKDCDILAAGKQADIIMIDLNQPNMQPIHNIPSSIVYSGSKMNVKMTMIAGKILYADGKFNVGEEPEALYEKCTRALEGLV